MNKFYLPALGAALILTPVAVAQVTIEKIAPEDTVFIGGADNVSTSFDRLKRTPLWELWESEEIRDLTHDALANFAEQLSDMYERLGVEEGSLMPPTGGAGMAIFTVPSEEEFAPNELGLMMFADYGDNADAIGELIDAALEDMSDDAVILLDEVDILGRTARVIEFLEPEEEEMDEEDFGMDDFGGNPLMPDAEQFTSMMNKMYLVREGDVYLAASSVDPLRGALETIEGDDSPRVDSREDFQAARAQIGDVDGYGLILMRDFGSIVSLFDESGMMSMMVGPSVPALLGDIGAIGAGYRADGEQAMVEQTFTMYMPNGKGGIFALVDHPEPREDLPAFVGTDAVGYSALTFDFDGVLEWVRSVINSNGMLQMQLAQNMPMVEEIIRGICDPLGDSIHIIQTLRQPIEADSMGTLVAIECHDPEAFEEMIAAQGAAIGLEPRDFLGGRIYTMEGGMMPMGGGMGEGGMSLGLGGGYLFMGQTAAVEQGLRTAGADDVASLGDDDLYQRGVGTLAGDALVAWGYTSFVESLKASAKVAQLQMEDSIKQMEEFDPEMAAEMKAELAEGLGFMDKFDFELLEQYFGPSVWQIRSTDDGFVMHTFMLDAGDE